MSFHKSLTPSIVQIAGQFFYRQGLRRFVLAGLLLCLGGAAIAAPTAPGAPRLLGLGISINDPPNAVALAKTLGVNALRVDAPWKQIETTPRNYSIPEWLERTVNSMNANGVAPLLILAYGNPLYDGGDKPTSREGIEAFARYAAFVVQHFKGRVYYYDLWNEWDAHTGRTTPLGADDYVNLARIVYPAIKAVDRDVQVLSGGISDKGIREGFFPRFFQLGGNRFLDGLSVHPYVWNSRKRKTPEGAMEMLDQVAQWARAANGGVDLPVYLTEIGWPTYTGKDGITEEEASQYLTRYFLLAASREYVRGIFWYCLMDQGNNPANKEHRFGVLDRAQQARPAARELKSITAVLSGNTRVVIRPNGRLTNAEVMQEGQTVGRYTWEEGVTLNNVSEVLKSTFWVRRSSAGQGQPVSKSQTAEKSGQ